MAQEADAIPGYRIVGKIASGGLGTIFRALDKRSFQDVAIKILYPEKAKKQLILNRFIFESQLLISIDSPYIVKGIARGQVRDLHYLVMEYIRGQTLEAILCATDRIVQHVALKVMSQIARALSELEKRNLVHCDLKPENILVTDDNNIKLCDLGLAELSSSEVLGMADSTFGTPEFMSPEQAMGKMDLDVRSDIYSLGIIFYRMLFGRLPFTGSETSEILRKQSREREIIDDVTQMVSPAVCQLVEKMLAKDRTRRFQSCAGLIKSLELFFPKGGSA